MNPEPTTVMMVLPLVVATIGDIESTVKGARVVRSEEDDVKLEPPSTETFTET